MSITTEKTERGYTGLLDQGMPEFLGVVTERDLFARAFDLLPDDLHPDLPLEVVSTGLRYLILPFRAGALERARIRNDITELLRRVNAQFADAVRLRQTTSTPHIGLCHLHPTAICLRNRYWRHSQRCERNHQTA